MTEGNAPETSTKPAPVENQGAETPRPAPSTGHRPFAAAEVPATLVPEAGGWHFLHLFYRIDRAKLAQLSEAVRFDGRNQVIGALDPHRPGAPTQIQSFAVPGHKADFGVMMAGTDLLAIHEVETLLQSSLLGPALVPTYSFYSLSEISEYVPSVDDYAKLLQTRENLDPESKTYQTKLKAYADRLGPMNKQRLTPDFPAWPCFCFYPMSKMRQGDQNWYTLPFAERNELMSQHGKSGMRFAGKVMQVITASTGIDDWEWGVTLWAKNPSYLKDIVYTMRFDESSAKYALFGDFYFGFILSPDDLCRRVRL